MTRREAGPGVAISGPANQTHGNGVDPNIGRASDANPQGAAGRKRGRPPKVRPTAKCVPLTGRKLWVTAGKLTPRLLRSMRSAPASRIRAKLRAPCQVCDGWRWVKLVHMTDPNAPVWIVRCPKCNHTEPPSSSTPLGSDDDFTRLDVIARAA
jgi:hypothetical protein